MSEKRARKQERRQRRQRAAQPPRRVNDPLETVELGTGEPVHFEAPAPFSGQVAITGLAWDHEAWDASDQRAYLDEDPCPRDRYVLTIDLTPEHGPWKGSISVFYIPLEERPSKVFMTLLARYAQDLGVRLERLEPELHNDVPQWQVAPGDSPISREEGISRIVAADAALN
jgi:hypothetical protein